jgi:hypothetical protein
MTRSSLLRPLGWVLVPLVFWSCNSITGANEIKFSNDSGEGGGGTSGGDDDDTPGDDDDDTPTSGTGGTGGAGTGGTGGAGTGGSGGGTSGNGGGGGGGGPPICVDKSTCVECCSAPGPSLDNIGRDFLKDCFCDLLPNLTQRDSSRCEQFDSGDPCLACCEAHCNDGGGSDDVAACLACAENGSSARCANIQAYCDDQVQEPALCAEFDACVAQCR